MKKKRFLFMFAALFTMAQGAWAQATYFVTHNDMSDKTDWTISPTEAAEDATVTVSYTGIHKVKSISVAKPTVGKSDFSSVYLGATSRVYQLNEGEMATFTFVNHTDKAENWNNFIAWVKNSDNANLRMLRGDAWDDALGSNAGIVSNFEWGTFRNDIDGATVVVTFKYCNSTVSVRADITTTDNRAFYETASVDAIGTVSVCMTIGNGCYLSDVTSVKSTYTNNIIGNEDNTTPYLGAHTRMVAIERGQTVTYRFTNYTSKGGNWTNFVAAASNASGTIMLLRADAWENIQVGNTNIIHNFDWATFQDDMDGASVVLTYTYYSNGCVVAHADITTTSNKSFYEEYIYTRAVTGTLTTWVTVDKSHLVMSEITTGTAPAPSSLNITNPAVGQVICSDGKNYNYGSQPSVVYPMAKICYVSGSNGLALAMTDEGTMNWETAISTAAAHIAPFTGGTWKLPTLDEWKSMMAVSGYEALRDGFTSVGGTNLLVDYGYWSSSEYTEDTGWAMYPKFIDGKLYNGIKSNVINVRACLEF